MSVASCCGPGIDSAPAAGTWSVCGQRLPGAARPSEITIVMEPTRNAWVPLAAWFRRQGANVVLVSAERSADLRAYYAKHTKSDRLDSVLLARLPMLHPEGCTPNAGWGPATRCAGTKLHSTWSSAAPPAWLVSTRCWRSSDPDWHAAFGADLGNKTSLRFLAAGYADPHTVQPTRRRPAGSVPLPALPRRLRRRPRRRSSWPPRGQPSNCGPSDLRVPRPGRGHRRSKLGWRWRSPRRSRSSTSASPCCVRDRDPNGIITSAPASAR